VAGGASTRTWCWVPAAILWRMEHSRGASPCVICVFCLGCACDAWVLSVWPWACGGVQIGDMKASRALRLLLSTARKYWGILDTSDGAGTGESPILPPAEDLLCCYSRGPSSFLRLLPPLPCAPLLSSCGVRSQLCSGVPRRAPAGPPGGQTCVRVRVLEDGELETVGACELRGALDHVITAHPKVDALQVQHPEH